MQGEISSKKRNHFEFQKKLPKGPMRPKWGLGAGGKEPRDSSSEAVSDAVSSAE